MEEAAEFLEKSIQTSQKGCCSWLEMKSLIALGHTMLLPGQKNKAFQKLEEALQISEEIGDKRWKASALFDLGNAHYADGRYEEARKFYENSLQLIAKLPQIGIWVYIRLGTVLVELKQFDEAMKLLHKALEIWEEDKPVYQTLLCRNEIFAVLCHLHLLLGQPEKATEYVNKILTGSWHKSKHVSLSYLGAYITAHGHFEEACDILAESIKSYENYFESLNDKSKLTVGDIEVNIMLSATCSW